MNDDVYSLQLTCREDEVDQLSGELWEAQTEGIREIDEGAGNVRLIAGFADANNRQGLLAKFANHSPQWWEEAPIDWVKETENSWPGRNIGNYFHLVPPWSENPTPPGRTRLIHVPGRACGTGEHPCSQLAIGALETLIQPGMKVADIGSGSGILTIAALYLGAGVAVPVDNDPVASEAALENFQLNGFHPLHVTGSAEALRSSEFDVTVANISGTVILAILDELQRITKPGGHLILTGFPSVEAPLLVSLVPGSTVTSSDGWSCIVARHTHEQDPAFVETER